MEKRYMGFDDLLVRGAEEYGDKVALIYGDDKSTASWKELDAQVRARAAELSVSGKTSIAILANGSYPCFVEILAANIAGLQRGRRPVVLASRARRGPLRLPWRRCHGWRPPHPLPHVRHHEPLQVRRPHRREPHGRPLDGRPALPARAG